MNGPSDNWKFMELLQQEQHEQYSTDCAGELWPSHPTQCLQKCLLCLVVCEDRAYSLSQCASKDYSNHIHKISSSVATIGSNLAKVEESHRGVAVTGHAEKLPSPGTASFDTLEVALKDLLILAKLHFLTTYQTDEPMIPFLGQVYEGNDILVFDTAILFHLLLSKFVSLKYPAVSQVACLDPSMMNSYSDVRVIKQTWFKGLCKSSSCQGCLLIEESRAVLI